ncbi:MAG: ATP-dependent DNA helicase [Vicinamibacterales bacterium]
MPEVPAVPGPAGLNSPVASALGEAVDAAFSDGGPLARAVGGFETREGQRAMAAAVAGVIERSGTLLAEAGTGTGKTLAYLVPAILSRQRVLISTGTKNLQEQIYFKDLPALQTALGIPFTATLMKGRSNYLCLHRYEVYRSNALDESFARSERPEQSERAIFLPVINAWLTETQTGDRAELRDLPEDLPFWKDIAADAETCLGSECPRYGDCFVTLMRQRAAESDLVIVNHHLLCADAAVRQSDYGEVIPACATLVVDEAHQLEDVATQYFGVAFSNFRVEDLTRDGVRIGGTGALGDRTAELDRDIERVHERSRTFFSGLAMRFDSRSAHPEPGRGVARMAGALPEARTRYTSESMAEHFEEGMMLAGAIEGLEATLALASTAARGLDATGADTSAGGAGGGTIPGIEAIDALRRRAGELRTDLRFLMRASDPDFVYFLDVRGRALDTLRAPRARRGAGSSSERRRSTSRGSSARPCSRECAPPC